MSLPGKKVAEARPSLILAGLPSSLLMAPIRTGQPYLAAGKPQGPGTLEGQVSKELQERGHGSHSSVVHSVSAPPQPQTP